MSEKKKVYVETTVVSDATALPINDLALVRSAGSHAGCTEICTPQMLQEVQDDA